LLVKGTVKISVHHKGSEQNTKTHVSDDDVTYSCPIVHANILMYITFQYLSYLDYIVRLLLHTKQLVNNKVGNEK